MLASKGDTKSQLYCVQFVHLSPYNLLWMTPALAKATESDTFEELGRATLQIVHDLKNQLNGLKLYATFLRKRLEQDERAVEERETLAKLISGLDRAARDMTMLVQYARPLQIRRQSNVDLRRMLNEITREVAGYNKPNAIIRCETDEKAYGAFDAVALPLALTAITEQAIGGGNTTVSIRMHKTSGQEVVIEWIRSETAKGAAGPHSADGPANVRKALATRIIHAHEGHLESEADAIRVRLPLTQSIPNNHK
jgi:hypothetical protein